MEPAGQDEQVEDEIRPTTQIPKTQNIQGGDEELQDSVAAADAQFACSECPLTFSTRGTLKYVPFTSSSPFFPSVSAFVYSYIHNGLTLNVQ